MMLTQRRTSLAVFLLSSKTKDKKVDKLGKKTKKGSSLNNANFIAKFKNFHT